MRELVQIGGEAPSIETPEQSNQDYTYLYGGAGPHQATQIGDTLYTYDGNGNTLTRCRAGQGRCGGTAASPGGPPGQDNHTRSFTWTGENWLRAVIDGGGQNATRFFYDASGQRVAKLETGGTSLSIGQFFVTTRLTPS